RSAWSRAITPPMEISDISEEESMKYLIEKRKIDEEMAKELYQLVGGRILELKTIANGILAGRSIEDIKKQKLIDIGRKFDSTKLLQEQKYYEAGKRVINALLDSKEISIITFKRIFKNNEKEYSEVLGNNVFAYRPSRDT
ncbi:17199_t:CDS:2, partial [Funneliformis caledonium]